MCDIFLCLAATGHTGTPPVGRHNPAPSMMTVAPTCEAVKAFFSRRRTQSIAALVKSPVTRMMQSVKYQVVSHSHSHISKKLATKRLLSDSVNLQSFERIFCLTFETIFQMTVEPGMYKNVAAPFRNSPDLVGPSHLSSSCEKVWLYFNGAVL